MVGMLGGGMLTYLGHAQATPAVFLSIWALALPFLLALITGAAKTTTAWGVSMIMTIGSLVQETFNRSRWLLATGIYTLACLATSSLLGALLSSVGFLLHQASAGASLATPVFAGGSVLVGMLAIAYAFGDAGLIRLPRPSVIRAVPVTWWRWWSPYWAALAYGAALGLGVTTYIEFGAFYILCLWCVLKGELAYGAVLMGTYGLARALVLPPLSWCAYRDGGNSQTYFSRLVNQLGNAKLVVAVALILFGTYILLSTVL
jgi:hypothetical protein